MATASGYDSEPSDDEHVAPVFAELMPTLLDSTFALVDDADVGADVSAAFAHREMDLGSVEYWSSQLKRAIKKNTDEMAPTRPIRVLSACTNLGSEVPVLKACWRAKRDCD